MTDDDGFPLYFEGSDELNGLDTAARCAICHSFFDAPLTLKTCGHSFCSACIRQNLDFQEKTSCPQCPSCRSPCDARDLMPNVCLRELVEKYTTARRFILQHGSGEVQKIKANVEKQPTRGAQTRHQHHGLPDDPDESSDILARKPKRFKSSTEYTSKRITRRSAAGRAREKANTVTTITLTDPVNNGVQSAVDVPSHAAAAAATTTTTTRSRSHRKISSLSLSSLQEQNTGDVEDHENATSLLGNNKNDDCDDGGGCELKEVFSISDTDDDEGDRSNDEEYNLEDDNNGDDDEDTNSDSPNVKRKKGHIVSSNTLSVPNPAPRTAIATNTSTPSGFVECPICSKSVPSFYINSHVDQCLGGGNVAEETLTMKTAVQGKHHPSIKQRNTNTNNTSTATKTEPFVPLALPSRLVAAVSTEKTLRAALKKYNLPTDGKKAELMERYNQFRLIVTTANDRQERVTYQKLAQRVAALEKQRAAAAILGGGSGPLRSIPHTTSNNNNHHHQQQQHANTSVIGSAHAALAGPGSIPLQGSSFKELIRVTKARDAARKKAPDVTLHVESCCPQQQQEKEQHTLNKKRESIESEQENHHAGTLLGTNATTNATTSALRTKEEVIAEEVRQAEVFALVDTDDDDNW